MTSSSGPPLILYSQAGTVPKWHRHRSGPHGSDMFSPRWSTPPPTPSWPAPLQATTIFQNLNLPNKYKSFILIRSFHTGELVTLYFRLAIPSLMFVFFPTGRRDVGSTPVASGARAPAEVRKILRPAASASRMLAWR
jgi:hypothetical protein